MTGNLAFTRNSVSLIHLGSKLPYYVVSVFPPQHFRSLSFICIQPGGALHGQLHTQCIYCDALCTMAVACVSSIKGKHNLTLKSYSTESEFNSRILQENIIIIHLSWIPLGLLSHCFLTHCLFSNFSIMSLTETWWNIQWMNFIGFGCKKSTGRCNF